MAEIGYTASILLAVVLLGAGVGKLRDPAGAARSAADLGVPAAAVVGRALPFVELVVAGLLLVVPPLGALAALALLVAFTVLLASAVRSGSGVSCRCFGAVIDRPVSVVEIVRNLMLAGLAVVAVAADRPVRPNLASWITVSAGAATGLLVLALLGLRRDVGAVWSNRLGGDSTTIEVMGR